MYDSLAANCKVFINIKGGGHCYFADANFICSLGEIGCPAFTITREQQHATTLDFTRLYLEYYLKKLPGTWTVFNDSLNNSPRITFQKSCTTTSVKPGIPAWPLLVFPNPSGDVVTLKGSCSAKEHIFVAISDIYGKRLHSFILDPYENQYQVIVDMKSWTSGIYIAEIRSSQDIHIARIVKN